MALEVEYSICRNQDCESFKVKDTTGVYNASSNTGGYGTPNPLASATTQLVINITPYGTTTPIVVTLTITSGVVSAATRDGVNILSSLNTTAYPFTTNNELIITSVMLGLTGSLDDGVWSFSYSATVSGTVYTYSSDVLFDCQTDCCVQDMFIHLRKGCCSELKDNKAIEAMKARAFLLSAQYALSVNSDITTANDSLIEAGRICSKECATCN